MFQYQVITKELRRKKTRSQLSLPNAILFKFILRNLFIRLSANITNHYLNLLLTLTKYQSLTVTTSKQCMLHITGPLPMHK